MKILQISTSMWAQWEMIFGPPLNWTLLLPLADLTSRQKLHTTCLPRQNWLKYFLNCQILAHKISRKEIGKKKLGCYLWKIVYFFPISKYINGYTRRRCGLCYGLLKRYIFKLRGPIQFSSTESWRAIIKNIYTST